MRNTAQRTSATTGTHNRLPELQSANNGVPAFHTSTRSNRANFGSQCFQGASGASARRVPRHSSRIDAVMRARTSSAISILGNRRNRPGGNGPSNAEFDGGRKSGTHALRPSSLANISTSTAPQQRCASFLNRQRSSRSGYGSKPRALIEKRDNASAAELSLPALRNATRARPLPSFALFYLPRERRQLGNTTSAVVGIRRRRAVVHPGEGQPAC